MKKADPFYLSQDWRDVRVQALRRDRWRCVLCGASVHARGWARVDHIETRKARPDLALTLSNLRTLCVRCDNQRHAEKGRKGQPTDYGSTPTGQPRDPAHWWNQRPPTARVDVRALAANDVDKGE
jgi:5-methylcytosine-specific restriction protein A